jgi:four helix bundle protein
LARYLSIAIKSATEVEYQLLKARDHGLLTNELWASLSGETVEVRKMTHGYRKKVLDSTQ